MQIEDNVMLVAGGGSGLGLATANALRAKGATVGMIDIRQGDWDGDYAEADVSDSAAVTAAVNALADRLGPIRALVNTAGVGKGGLTIGEGASMTADIFRRQLEIHTLGSFNLCQAVGNRMLTQDTVGPDGERGVIINTSSITVQEGQIGSTAYAAAKGGVEALALGFAREFARFGIRVNCISPGIFASPMLADDTTPMGQWLRTLTQFPRRTGEPSEYAALAMQLITNTMMNGNVIRLDGAMRVPEGDISLRPKAVPQES